MLLKRFGTCSGLRLTTFPGDSIVAAKKLPEFMSSLHEDASPHAKPSKITYAMREGIARTVSYYPKDAFVPRIRGTGFFLDLMALDYLRKKWNAERAGTSSDPKQPRKNQLESVGLRAIFSQPVKEWEIGLGKGVLRGINEASGKQGPKKNIFFEQELPLLNI